MENPKVQITSQIDDDYGRKVWQVKELKQIQLQVEEKQQEELRYLESRKEDLDFNKVIQKKVGVTKDDDTQESGFYCNICDVMMKDSSSYLDHINGKKHNKLKGMNMKVERVSVDKVKEKFKSLKKKQDTKITSFEDFEKKFEKEQQVQNQVKKKVKVDNKQIEQEIINQVDVSQFEAMGLPMNFGMRK